MSFSVWLTPLSVRGYWTGNSGYHFYVLRDKIIHLAGVSCICCCSVAQLCLTLCDPMGCSTPGLPVLHHLPSLSKFMSIASVMPSSLLILWYPLILRPSIFPSIRDFSNESAVHLWWPEYWSFSFNISLSNEYWGLITLKIDWFDLLAVQGTFQKSLAPHFEANSLAFCLLYGPALTTIRDHWEDHSLDYMDLCLQSNVSAFQHTVWVCHSFPAKKQSSSDFWTSGVIFTPHLISKPGNGKGMVVNSPEDHGWMCACVWVFVYLVGWKHP